MAQSSFTLTGGAVFRQRLVSLQNRIPDALHAATEEALDVVLNAARQILQEEIYGKAHENDFSPPDKDDPDSLWAAFVTEIARIGSDTVSAQLLNTSPHARFIEGGTDDEGTGSHYVAAIRGHALAWMNGATGQMAFSKGHEVKGIKPYRFMERALHENRAAVIDIYKKHVRSLLR